MKVRQQANVRGQFFFQWDRIGVVEVAEASNGFQKIDKGHARVLERGRIVLYHHH